MGKSAHVLVFLLLLGPNRQETPRDAECCRRFKFYPLSRGGGGGGAGNSPRGGTISALDDTLGGHKAKCGVGEGRGGG